MDRHLFRNVPVESGTTVFFIAPLKNAKAEVLVAELNTLHGANGPGPAARGPAALQGTAFFVANIDTNSLQVIADRLFEKAVRLEIQKLDEAAAPGAKP